MQFAADASTCGDQSCKLASCCRLPVHLSRTDFNSPNMDEKYFRNEEEMFQSTKGMVPKKNKRDRLADGAGKIISLIKFHVDM